MNAMVPVSNTEAYRASTDAAELCKGIVVASAMVIGDRKSVKVEGWQAIAIAHGCTGSARDVERIEGGVRAVGEIRRMSDGAIIAEAEGFVGEDEPTWFGGTVEKDEWTGPKGNRHKTGKTITVVLPKRADYAIRAMAQTRAISRACRSAFAHVVVMMNAGLSTTPAEEVPAGGFDDEPRNITPDKPTTTSGKAVNTVLEAFIATMKMNKTLEKVDAWASREANAIMEKLNRRDQDAMQAAYETWRNEIAARDPATEATAEEVFP